MKGGRGCCDGCAALSFEPPMNRYDVWLACCRDEDKPVLGTRRVVATGQTRPPRQIERPAWCRKKRDAPASERRDVGTCAKTNTDPVRLF